MPQEARWDDTRLLNHIRIQIPKRDREAHFMKAPSIPFTRVVLKQGG